MNQIDPLWTDVVDDDVNINDDDEWEIPSFKIPAGEDSTGDFLSDEETDDRDRERSGSEDEEANRLPKSPLITDVNEDEWEESGKNFPILEATIVENG